MAEKKGKTKVSNFRLSPEVLAELDAVAADLTAQHGKKQGRTDAIRVLALGQRTKGSVMLPHYGDVPCGEPTTLPDDPPVMTIDLAGLFRGPERFLLTARGQSMKNNLIGDGDLLVIARKDTAAHGQMVVAFVDGEVTLKTYHIRKNGKKTEHWLYPASDHHEPRMIDPAADAKVLGVLVGVIRKV